MKGSETRIWYAHFWMCHCWGRRRSAGNRFRTGVKAVLLSLGWPTICICLSAIFDPISISAAERGIPVPLQRSGHVCWVPNLHRRRARPVWNWQLGQLNTETFWKGRPQELEMAAIQFASENCKCWACLVYLCFMFTGIWNVLKSSWAFLGPYQVMQWCDREIVLQTQHQKLPSC